MMILRMLNIRYAAKAGWSLYALAMVALFFVLTFPYDHLHAKLLALLSERTGLDVRSERWTVLWPAGIAWNNLSLTAPGLPNLQADLVQLELKLPSVLRAQPVFEWTGRLGNGRGGIQGLIKTRLALTTWSLAGPAQILGSIEQVNLAGLAIPMVKTGMLRTEFDQRLPDLSHADRFLTGDGTWQVEVTGLALEHIPIGPMAIPALTLSTVSGRLFCQSGTCRIQGLKGEGPDGTFNAEGVLIPHEPPSNSQLTMTLSLTVADALKQRLDLKGVQLGTPGMPLRMTISGALSNLRVSL